jgi:hypothetical protein
LTPANLDLSRLPQYPEREKQRLEAEAREQIVESTRQTLGRVLEWSGTLASGCEQTHKGSKLLHARDSLLVRAYLML